jgi:glycosyltransferase involved in cell wall biosynthesis
LREERIYICVTNDLVTDQRVDRTAACLHDRGYKVTLIGRSIPSFSVTVSRDYDIKSFRLLFNKGFLFYASYNIRLFFYLAGKRISLIIANDLDTLLPSYLISRIKNVPLLYDSHEYFTEVPELKGRTFVRWVWLLLERLIVPRLRFSMTVNESLAAVYREKYGITMEVVRNLPRFSTPVQVISPGGPPRRHVILYQGALNKGRGLEKMILAMKSLDRYKLWIIGDGDIRKILERLVHENKLEDRITFLGRKPFDELNGFTSEASLGISLEEQAGLNYYYALPNKLFNYIQARIPVLVSAFPEMKKIVSHYDIGMCLDNPGPETIAMTVKKMIEDQALRSRWLANLEIAAGELCWEKELQKLERIINKCGL